DHRRPARQPARRHHHRRDRLLPPRHGAAGRHRRARQGLSVAPRRRPRERARLRADEPARRSVVLGAGSAHPSPRGGEGLMLRRVLRRRKSALVGAVILAVIALAALFAPALAPYDPIKIRPGEALSPPSLAYPFGTDQYGRDILSRAMTGARLSLLTGLGAVAVALTAGVVVGLASGAAGRGTGLMVRRVVDRMRAVPGIVLRLAELSWPGPASSDPGVGRRSQRRSQLSAARVVDLLRARLLHHAHCRGRQPRRRRPARRAGSAAAIARQPVRLIQGPEPGEI